MLDELLISLAQVLIPRVAADVTEGKVWQVFNSQVVLTLLTVSVGGLFAAWLTARWQRDSELFKTRIDAIKTLLERHKDIAGALERGDPIQDMGTVYQVNVSLAFLGALFPGKAERLTVKEYYDVLTKAIAEQTREKRIELGEQAGSALASLIMSLVRETGIAEGVWTSALRTLKR
jgi:hypothetical protein